MANTSGYSKGAFAEQLGISRGELENRAKSAGFGTTEDYYNSGQWNNNASLDNIPSVTDFVSGLEPDINKSLSNLTMGYRAIRNPLDVYSELEESMNLPQQRKVAQTLRDQVADLEDSIRRVRPTIAATTRESMVTEGQRAMMETAQKRPFQERLAQISTALGRVDESIAAGMQDLGTKVSLYLQGAQMSLEPLKIQYQAMVDRAARLTSAFGIDAQNQLNVLLTKVKRGWELQDQEREEAFALIQNENEYKNTLLKTGAGLGVTFTGNEDVNDILNLIGSNVAEQIEYEKDIAERELAWKMRDKDGGPTDDEIGNYEEEYFDADNWYKKYIIDMNMG